MRLEALGLMVLALLGWLIHVPIPAAAIDVAWTYVPVPGPVADVSVGPDGNPWIVLTDTRLFRFNGTSFDEVAGQPALRVAVTKDGVPWVISPDGAGYRRSGDVWERMWLINRAVDLAAGADGNMWYTDSRGRVYTMPATAGTSSNLVQDSYSRVAGSPDGSFWAVKADGTISVPVGRAIRTIPGKAQDVGVGANGAVWITGPDDSISVFTGTGWERVTYGAARWVSVGADGAPWVVNRTGELYRGAPAGTTTPGLPPGPAPITPPANALNRPLIAFLCKVADKADEPRTVDQVQAMLAGPGGFADYIREQSLGALTLNGTQVYGWFQLPNPDATYRGDGRETRLANDCAAAAPQVIVPDNALVAFFSNGPGIQGGVAFQWRTTIGGVNKTFDASAYSSTSLISPAMVAHEVGHNLGFGHSYQSWDPLGGATFGNELLPDPVGPLGPGYNAYHRDRAGWIPATRKFTYTGTVQQLTLTRLTLPTTNDFLMAQIPIGDGSTFYTVELRTYAGADAIPNKGVAGNAIPGEAVLIHRVTPQNVMGEPDPNAFDTRVVVANATDKPDSEGAMWRPGKTYTDAANNISVRIDSLDVLRGVTQITIGPAR